MSPRARLGEIGKQLKQVFALPPLGGYRLTVKRRLNLYLNRYEYFRGRSRLRSYPLRLVVEPASACNLHCPYCITGAGGRDRASPMMTLALYRRLLDELGDYLFDVEAFQWGEPLLNKHLWTMVAEASVRGIATTINSNLSLPLEADTPERIISSGLTELTVSVDGARQETYEQYRVGGDLALVRENCRRIVAAKARLAAPTPRLNLEFHVFPHNVADVDDMRRMAGELGMGLRVFKGVVPGRDWDSEGKWPYCVAPIPTPCIFLWGTAVVSSDGGVLPCRGAFYRRDDMGRIAVHPGELGTASFRSVWNGERFRTARRFYRARTGSPEEEQHICFNCPNTIMVERWRQHRDQGGTSQGFDPGYTLNDIWNYFWDRRPPSAMRPHQMRPHRNGEHGRAP